MSAIRYWLWLAGIHSLDAARIALLLDDFGSPENIYFAEPAAFERFPELPAAARQGLSQKSTTHVDVILESCDRLDIRILTMQDALYPFLLRQIPNPPSVLYYRGRLPVLDEEPTLTIVGTRKATVYGQEVAERFGRKLAEQGMVIISGMASGVDGCALRGAMKAGAFAVAVLGCGIDVIYPMENADLYRQLCATGLLLSEYPPGTQALGSNFPARNRIMAGLSRGTLVAEAGIPSGAMITAHYAADYGRDVYAVPGSILTPHARGCHELIQNGAQLVCEPYDILREYINDFPHKLTADRARARTSEPRRPARVSRAPEPEPPAKPAAPPPDLPDSQRDILNALAAEPHSVDELMQITRRTAPELLGDMTLLEIGGHISLLPDRRWRRNN